MARVCHVSSAHQSHDIRIFIKECRSLARAGHDVSFVVFGESEEIDGVKIVGLGAPPASRKERMTAGARKAYDKAASLGADIYHLHDPELLPFAKRLCEQGAKAVFDSHEDVAGQIMGKEWIPRFARRLVSLGYRRFETTVMRHIDAVVAATPRIAECFDGRAKKVVVVNNYPVLDDVVFQQRPFSERPLAACYTGGVSIIRGGQVMIDAMRDVEGSLVIAGPSDINLDACANDGRVSYLGVVPHNQVNDVYAQSRAGVILYQPAENHCASQPNKLFEYMAAGLPVVASNFPLWKEVVEGNKCGLCVPPDDASAVGRAIASLLDDPERAQEMGRNGRRAVERCYNWDNEESSLVSLYVHILA